MVKRDRHKLGNVAKVGYGFGHVLNDICATLWFGYGLVWMQNTLELSSSNCGYIILVAQVADAIFNLWVGTECDKVSVISSFGRRKGWHAIGTVMVIVGIVFSFIPPFTYQPGITPQWMAVFHMMSCQVLFNAGWAIAQIAHLSLIPTLAKNQSDEIQLNSIRQGMVYAASILVYILAGFIIKDSDVGAGLDWSTRYEIITLAMVSICLGALFASLFLYLTPETATDTPLFESTCIRQDTRPTLTAREWAKKPGFFRVCFAYTMARLMYNQSLLFFPVLISNSLKFPNSYIGFCPLVLYASGMILSFTIPYLLKFLSKKALMFISAMFMIGGMVWLEFFTTATDQIWGVSIILGMGAAGVLIMALASIVDIIGENKESSSFIYGTYSVADKVMNGVAALVTQMLSPCGDFQTQQHCHDAFPSFFGRMLAVFAVLSAISYICYPQFNRHEEEEGEHSILGSIIVSSRFQRTSSISLSISRHTDERRPLLTSK